MVPTRAVRRHLCSSLLVTRRPSEASLHTRLRACSRRRCRPKPRRADGWPCHRKPRRANGWPCRPEPRRAGGWRAERAGAQMQIRHRRRRRELAEGMCGGGDRRVLQPQCLRQSTASRMSLVIVDHRLFFESWQGKARHVVANRGKSNQVKSSPHRPALCFRRRCSSASTGSCPRDGRRLCDAVIDIERPSSKATGTLS